MLGEAQDLTMRQVNRDEFAWAIASALRKVSPAIRNQFASRVSSQHRQAQAMIAIAVADELRRYEVLTDAPAPGLAGDEAFTRPLNNMLAGK
jgi:hypothetical protein